MTVLPLFSTRTVYEEALVTVLAATRSDLEAAKDRLEPASVLRMKRHQIDLLDDLLTREIGRRY